MQEPHDKPIDKRLWIIFLIQFTEVSGFALVLPIFPFLGLRLGLSEFQIGLLASIFSVCQLFAAPITGKLSDRFGRKPLLIISQISTLLGFTLLGLANSVIFLVVARMIDGLLGSNMTVAQAVISDLSDEDTRTKAFSYSAGFFGAGLIVGPAIGGYFVQISYGLPMFIAAGISLLSIILVILFLPETNPAEESTFTLHFDDIIPIKNIKTFFKNQSTKLQLISFLFYFFGFALFVVNLSLYVISKYGVPVEMASYYRIWIGILQVILQTLVVHRLIRARGELPIIRLGVVSLVIAMIGLIFSQNYRLVFLPLTFLAFGNGVTRPVLTSRLSKAVTRKESATLLGVNNTMASIAQIIAPIVGGAVIQYLTFELVPTLSGICFLIMLGLTFKIPSEIEIKDIKDFEIPLKIDVD